MNGNLTHWQPISSIEIRILSSKWPIKLLWTYICKYHNPGDCWPSCDEQWTWFLWRTQFGGSETSENRGWGKNEEWGGVDWRAPPFGGECTFLRLHFYCLKATGSPCHFSFDCPTVSGTFLDLPLMKLISCVQIHINTCIRHIEIERNESYGECLCIIPVIYSITSYRKT